MMKANALNEQGKVVESQAYLAQMQHTQRNSSSAVSAVTMMASIFDFDNGCLSQSVQGLQHLMNSAGLSGPSPFLRSHIHAYLGSIYYEWNQLESAVTQLTAVTEIAYGYSLSAFKRGWIMLAVLYQTQGEADKARQVIMSLYELKIAQEETNFFRNEVQSFHANLLLRQGALAQALQQFRMVRSEPFYPLDTPTEVPQLTEAQLLIAQGEEVCLAQAKEILQTLKATTGPIHNRNRRIKVLALEALLYQTATQTQKALAVLEEAITLAKPDHFIRTFADLGPAMAILLEQLRLRGFEPAYIAEILAAFSSSSAVTPITAVDRPAQQQQLPQSEPRSGALIEHLTARESEVLDLLAKRLSNKEIAHALDLSPFTVKNHLSTIFQKLGINGRREAVIIAKRAGLLH